jgi:MinD-like ATPase involved in chromosome partitioning or flagellar assembly
MPSADRTPTNPEAPPARGSWMSSLQAELARMGLGPADPDVEPPMPAPPPYSVDGAVFTPPASSSNGFSSGPPLAERDGALPPPPGPRRPDAIDLDALPATVPTEYPSDRPRRARHASQSRFRRANRDSQLTAEQLTPATVLRPRQPAPRRGWRRAVYAATGGGVNLGPSQAERREQDLISRARTPIADCHRLAVVSLKGGVGKTTTTAALGATFAALRGDRVVALDANPDRGTLAEKVGRGSTATVRDLLRSRYQIYRYTDVRAFTSQAPSRLEVLASDTDPAVSEAFSESDYRSAVDVLERYYSLILTDCGTGLLHSAMSGVLDLADSIIVVSSPSLDGARSASATLDWLEAHDYGDLVENACAVISGVRSGRNEVNLDRLEEHFAARCRAVVQVPFDAHLAAGAEIDLEQLGDRGRRAYLELAAAVGDGFAAE